MGQMTETNPTHYVTVLTGGVRDYAVTDADILVEVPLVNVDDEPIWLNVRLTDEGIIMDYMDEDGEVTATRAEMYADIAFGLAEEA